MRQVPPCTAERPAIADKSGVSLNQILVELLAVRRHVPGVARALRDAGVADDDNEAAGPSSELVQGQVAEVMDGQ